MKKITGKANIEGERANQFSNNLADIDSFLAKNIPDPPMLLESFLKNSILTCPVSLYQ